METRFQVEADPSDVPSLCNLAQVCASKGLGARGPGCWGAGCGVGGTVLERMNWISSLAATHMMITDFEPCRRG